jgi:LPXTG-motif cell wall-anchored protein
MKKLKALFASFILSLPFMLMAQEEGGTYIDNLGVQDSSYMETDQLAGVGEASSGNTAIYIVIAVVIIAVVAFVIIKKKKKK